MKELYPHHSRGVEWESIDFQLSLEGMMQGIYEATVSMTMAVKKNQRTIAST